jgi:activator of HSP90 ATPase
MMSNRENSTRRPITLTRRDIIGGAGAALAFGSFVPTLSAAPISFQGQVEPPSTGADKFRTYLHQEIDIQASPHRIYDVLLSSQQFAAFTGLPAEIDPKPGGAFSMFGGLIVGRNVELVPNQRIVQAWRPTS